MHKTVELSLKDEAGVIEVVAVSVALDMHDRLLELEVAELQRLRKPRSLNAIAHLGMEMSLSAKHGFGHDIDLKHGTHSRETEFASNLVEDASKGLCGRWTPELAIEVDGAAMLKDLTELGLEVETQDRRSYIINSRGLDSYAQMEVYTGRDIAFIGVPAEGNMQVP